MPSPLFDHLKGLRIDSRSGIPLSTWKLNQAQRTIYDAVFRQWDTEKCYRDRSAIPKAVILKARQLGCSAFIQSYLWMLASRYGYSCLTAAHRDIDARSIYDRYARRWYIASLGGQRKPTTKDRYRWDTQQTIELDTGGRVMIMTAGARSGGHSHTFQFLHLSEASRYPDARNFLKGVLGAASHAGVIIESTANGMTGDGEWFWKFWSESKAGLTGYTPIFLPWYLEPSYSSEQGSLTEEDLDEDEIELRGLGVSIEQLIWRRWTIQGPVCNGNVNTFKEQFPSVDSEAFLFSGQLFFDRKKSSELGERTRHTKGRVEGEATVWEVPRREYEYVIGVDVGEGIGLDESCVQVLTRTDPPRQVLEWASNTVDPVTLGRIVNDLAVRYNNAPICVEINNHGLTTQQKLQDIGGRDFYVRRQWDHFGKRYVERPGWKTTSQMKGLMLDHARIRVLQGSTGIQSEALAQEIAGYSRVADYHFRGEHRSHFDRLTAYCLALMMLEQRGAGTPLDLSPPHYGPVELYKQMLKRRAHESSIWSP